MTKIDRCQISESLKLNSNSIRFDSLLTDIPNRPATRPVELAGEGRIGAVLLLVVAIKQDPQIVLTRRSSRLRNHAGQISFPGGRQDGNESLQDTALRETEEEIGVGRDSIEILGQLSSVYIPPTDFTIFPFVGCCDEIPKFLRSADEVAEVVVAPLEGLLSPNAVQFGQVVSPNGLVNAQYFDVGGHRVWGATGIVLNEFLQRLIAAQST